MKRILQVTTSPRGEASYSNQLGNAIVQELLTAHPGSTTETLDLSQQQYPHLGVPQLVSFFTPPEAKTEEHHAASRHSDDAVASLLAADILVICTPLYNFNIPSSLKAWLDHIVRSGITFRYGATGAEGLVKGKKVYISLASGGIFSEGPYVEYDFVSSYLKAVFGFIGITDITILRVEGTAIPGVQDQALEKAVQRIAV
ncbi:NAD(P)H-dependent oxidoreductase [uncultured Chitinophaga sp.]|uniref:FMN-dependent NADH-azoreductase n=1 Tax=uncultured Chitinophaga sp. TaxID=339340 RepID=UPI0025F0F09B|nr:NAD(P)H-dependent oxidoreductase [uncultured Chitinophaga sp.]